MRIAGGVVRGALGSWTAGTVAAASASDVDVSEAGAARAVVERPDDCVKIAVRPPANRLLLPWRDLDLAGFRVFDCAGMR